MTDPTQKAAEVLLADPELLWYQFSFTDEDGNLDGGTKQRGRVEVVERVVKMLSDAGLLPSEEEWAVWRTWDNRYFPQASKEAALAVQVTDNFVPVSRYISPWKVRGDIVD